MGKLAYSPQPWLPQLTAEITRRGQSPASTRDRQRAPHLQSPFITSEPPSDQIPRNTGLRLQEDPG